MIRTAFARQSHARRSASRARIAGYLPFPWAPRSAGPDAATARSSRCRATRAYIYDLGWNSTAGELVIGTAAAVVGTLVCDEGATSGVRCGISINLTGQIASFSDPDSGPFTAENESEGVATDPNPYPHYVQAVAGGDSGGPVIINSDTLDQVYAAGTISGQDSRR